MCMESLMCIIQYVMKCIINRLFNSKSTFRKFGEPVIFLNVSAHTKVTFKSSLKCENVTSRHEKTILKAGAVSKY